MYAIDSGAVFNGEYNLPEGNKDLFIQSFKNETIQSCIGGAIVFKGMNEAGLTIVEDCKF